MEDVIVYSEGIVAMSVCTVLIEVTAEDIAKGRANHCQFCPLALAMSRALKRKIEIQHGHAWYSEGLTLRRSKLPDEATAWYRAYDTYNVGVPFSFEFVENWR
jgi:hypothetical protein